MASTKLTYAASAPATITLASLASSSTLVAGRQSTAIDNTTNLYLDYEVHAVVKASGTAPTNGGSIEMWIVPLIDDTPTWPDTFGGTDANVTVTSRDILGACARLAYAVTNDATANRVYHLVCGSVAALFGGICPAKFAIFIVQSTGQAINASGSSVTTKGVYTTTA